MRIALFTLTIFVCGIALTVGSVLSVPAAIAQSFSRDLEILSDLNRINPRQNPEYQLSADVLGRRILDRKNKVVGEVNDIVLRDSGNIELLNVELDRLRLGDIFLNYRSLRVEPVSDGYTLGFDSKQLEQLYPTLLADTQTAAGDNGVFSVRRVLKSEVRSDAGRRVGTVEDVLFSANGSRAEALLVKLSQGTLRGDQIAVPFNGSEFQDSGQGRSVVLKQALADALIEYAKLN